MFALRQANLGVSVAEGCRKMGISEANHHNWKKEYGVLGLPKLRRLRHLEKECLHFEQLAADLSLDKQMLQDVLKQHSKSCASSPRDSTLMRCISQLGIHLQRVILFDSYVRDEQREESDIDMALVSIDFTVAGPIDVWPMAHLLARAPFFYIEPHTFSPEQFIDWNPFVQEIKRTGIVIGEWEPTATDNRAIYM